MWQIIELSVDFSCGGSGEREDSHRRFGTSLRGQTDSGARDHPHLRCDRLLIRSSGAVSVEKQKAESQAERGHSCVYIPTPPGQCLQRAQTDHGFNRIEKHCILEAARCICRHFVDFFELSIRKHRRLSVLAITVNFSSDLYNIDMNRCISSSFILLDLLAFSKLY